MEYLEDWKFFKKIIKENKENLEEDSPNPKQKHPGTQGYLKTPFQKTMVKKHSKKKKDLIGKGGNKYKGGPYKYKLSFKRSKSAPPVAEANVKAILNEMQYFDLSQWNVRDALNHNVWLENELYPRPRVSAKLLEIAKDFFSLLKFKKVEIIDVKFTGSLANYNWTEGSDIDLHIVVDFSKISRDISLIRDYVMAKKSVWNEKHKILIHGHEVEVYVEDAGEMHYSSGVFSLMNNEWIVKPNKKKPVVDERQVMAKISIFQNKINELQDLYNGGNYGACYQQTEDLLNKLKKMRTAGLVKGGEFSIENLVYKALRKINAIGDLFKLKYDSYDQKMSIDDLRRTDMRHTGYKLPGGPPTTGYKQNIM